MSDRSPFSTVLSAGVVLFAGLVFQYVVSFGARVVMARLLGRVAFGAVTLGATLLSTTAVVVLLGTHNGVGRFLPRYDDVADRRGVLVAAFGVVVPLSVGVGGVVVLGADLLARRAFGDPGVAPVLRVFGVALPLAVVVRLTVATVRGRQEALPRVYVENVAQPLSRFALVAVAVGLGLGAVCVAVAYLVSYALVALLAVRYLRRTALFADVTPTPMRRALFSFSAPLLVVAATNMVFVNVDTFMLGYFSTTGAVGLYGVVYPLGVALTLVLKSVNFVAMPVISELHAAGRTDRLRRTYQVVAKWVLVATLPPFLVLVSFPGVVLRGTFGAEYADGAATLAVLAVGFFSHAVAGPSGNALTALGRTRTVMYVNVTVAAVNVAVNLLLIPWLGPLGAAVATVVGYLLLNGLYVTALYRAEGVHPFRARTLRPALLAGGCWVGVLAVARLAGRPTLPVVVGLAAGFVVVYLGVILRFGGVDPEERALVAELERRAGVDLDPLRALVGTTTAGESGRD
jgi:O-antigen/teichoic acid export membrane protein